MKKIICFLLSMIIICVSPISSLAARMKLQDSKTYPRYYMIGETMHIVNNSDCNSDKLTDAQITDGGVSISGGGSACWEFFLPYASRSVTVIYEGSGTINIKTDENTYNSHTLTGTGEDTIIFGENLGYSENPQWRTWPGLTWGVLQDYVEHPGEKSVTIQSDSDIKIKELQFEKELTAIHYRDQGYTGTYLPDISEFEMEMMSTVVMHEDSSVIAVNGGRRYIDNNNVYLKPIINDGKHYLPIETLAKALGYYYEDILSQEYALMRSEWHEVIKNKGVITVAEGTAAPVSAPAYAFLNHDGRTYAQVEYFTELMGETVGYKDGLIVIDDKYTVRDILNNEDFYNFALNKVSAFIETKEIGNTYHVSKNGNDNNSGMKEEPFLTLKKAGETAIAGDTVIVHQGVYRETLTPLNNGEPGAPITFKAAENENVVISAADIINTDSYTIGDKNEYIFDMPMDLGIGRNQIYINDESMVEARYPDDAKKHVTGDLLSELWGLRGEIYKLPGDNKTFYSDSLLNQQEDDYWKGGTYVGTFGYGYYMMTGLIESSTKGSFKVSDKYREQQAWNLFSNSVTKDLVKAPNYGMIVGHINALSLPTEWVRTEDGKLHIILPEATDIDTVQIEAKARQLVVDLTDKKFINVEGFKTIGGSVTTGDNGEMCMLNGLDMKYLNHYTLNADGRNGYIDIAKTADSAGRYYDNTKPGAPQRGEVGIYLGGTDEIIVNTKMEQAAGAAIYMTGVYSYIDNNVIDQCGYMGSYATAIHADTLVYENKYTPRGGYSIYNNTISTCSQSAIDFCKAEINVSSYRHLPYLPNEIAYNDVHDCNLTSVDAGAIYSNGCNAGFDKQMSNVHHNYIYKTIESIDGNQGDKGLFWDGQAHGFDSFENLIFCIGSESITNSVAQATSITNSGQAYERLWNNSELDYVKVDKSIPVADGIDDGFFPENRPFFAGSTIDRTSIYAKNVDRTNNSKNGIDYPAYNAELLAGVNLNSQNGYAYFTADGQYIHFKNVDFGSNSNEMLINYFSDSNWSYDELEIYIGGSYSKWFKKITNYKQLINVTLPTADPPDTDYTCSLRVKIGNTSGKNDVWIKVNKYYSIAIGGISVIDHIVDKTVSTIDDWAMHIYPAQYTDYNKDNKKAASGFMGKAIETGTETPGVFAVKSTWAGYTARYAKQELTQDLKKDVSNFVVSAGSNGTFAGQLMNIYLCPPKDAYTAPKANYLVAQFREVNEEWTQVTPLATKVIKDVDAGIYDVYVEFSDEEGTALGKTSNIVYFGFLKDTVDATEYTITKVPKLAVLYDAELTEQNNNKPLSKISYEGLNPEMRKLHNTLPLTKIGYTNVKSKGNNGGFAIKYYVADDSLAGQFVNIRVIDENNELISKGSFVTQPCEKQTPNIANFNLDNTVPEGSYTVHLDFGGWAQEDKSCQLYWFGFADAPANTQESVDWISGMLLNQDNEVITYSNLAQAQTISVDGCFAKFDSANPPTAILALYAEDNSLLDAKVLDVAGNNDNSTGVISGTIGLTEDVKESIDDARVYVWENWNTLRPIYTIPNLK